MNLGKSSYRKAYWNDVTKLLDWEEEPEELPRKGRKHLQRRDFLTSETVLFSQALDLP